MVMVKAKMVMVKAKTGAAFTLHRPLCLDWVSRRH
jgi:hypothetical protein